MTPYVSSLAEKKQGNHPNNSVDRMKSFSLEKQRFRGDLVNVYKYLKGDGFFLVEPSAMTRSSAYKLECRKFFLNTRKQFNE